MTKTRFGRSGRGTCARAGASRRGGARFSAFASAKFGLRGLVQALEVAVIETVAAYGIEAYGRRDAPGVYVEGRKLAAVGLRIRRNCSYHGLAINVDMDLEPFGRINPCGFEDLEVTQLRQLSAISELARVRRDIEPQLKLGLDHFSAAS